MMEVITYFPFCPKYCLDFEITHVDELIDQFLKVFFVEYYMWLTI